MKMFKNKKAHNMNAHIMIGIAVVGILYYLNTLYNWVIVPNDNIFYIQIIAIAIIYSLLPDSDQPASIINRYITVILGSIAVLSFLGYIMVEYGIASVVILVLLRLIEHRTIIHSALFALIMSLPLYYFFGLPHFIVGLTAYLSHIISDNDFSIAFERDWRWK